MPQLGGVSRLDAHVLQLSINPLGMGAPVYAINEAGPCQGVPPQHLILIWTLMSDDDFTFDTCEVVYSITGNIFSLISP